MRSGVFVFVAVLLGGCGTQANSLGSARTHFLEAQADYQACMNAANAEAINQCEPKRLAATAAQQAYADAMSSGVSNNVQ
jgi:hypothetical protein